LVLWWESGKKVLLEGGGFEVAEKGERMKRGKKRGDAMMEFTVDWKMRGIHGTGKDRGEARTVVEVGILRDILKLFLDEVSE
jgi:hypothetical protein